MKNGLIESKLCAIDGTNRFIFSLRIDNLSSHFKNLSSLHRLMLPAPHNDARIRRLKKQVSAL